MKYRIKILNSSEYDGEEWDRFVDESPQGSIFCRSWWLDAVCPDGYEILVLRKGDQIVAGMPLPRFRRFGIDEIRMPPLTQTLGPLLAPSTAEKYERQLSREMQILCEIVRALPDVRYFETRSHYSLTNWLPFYWEGYSQTTRYTYVFENLTNLEAVFAGMAASVRTRIRKAEKEGIRVEQVDDIALFWELNLKTFARQGLSPGYSLDLVRRLDEACVQRGARTILLARNREGNAIAAVYLVHDSRTMYYLMQGADPQNRTTYAGVFLMWHSIRSASEKGVAFDFEGSMIENVEPVFRHFSAHQKPYFRIWRDRRPLWIKAYQKLRGKAGRLARVGGLRKRFRS